MGLIKLECLPDNRNLLRFHGILVYIYIYFSKYITLIIEDAASGPISNWQRGQKTEGEGGGGKKEWGQRNGFLRVLGIAVLKIQIDQTAPKRVEGVVEQLNTWVAPKYSSIKALKYLYAMAHTLYKRVGCSFPLSYDYFVCINGDRGWFS